MHVRETLGDGGVDGDNVMAVRLSTKHGGCNKQRGMVKIEGGRWGQR